MSTGGLYSRLASPLLCGQCGVEGGPRWGDRLKGWIGERYGNAACNASCPYSSSNSGSHFDGEPAGEGQTRTSAVWLGSGVRAAELGTASFQPAHCLLCSVWPSSCFLNDGEA